MDNTKVFIMNMCQSGLGIARDLGPLGIPVYGLTRNPSEAGNFSKYCTPVFCPDYNTEPGAYLSCMISNLTDSDNRGIIFPTNDQDILFLENHRSDLEDYFILSLPRNGLAVKMQDKQYQMKVAAQMGLSIPRSFHVSSAAQLLGLKKQLFFPVVAKPNQSGGWHNSRLDAQQSLKGCLFYDWDGLFGFVEKIAALKKEVQIQEWITGKNNQYFIMGAYFDQNSKCLGAFTAQKMLQYPEPVGLGCVYKTIHNRELLDIGIHFLSSLNYSGLAEIEFKQDQKTGEFKLIEVNTRHWDQHTLGAFSGVNLSHLAYLDLLGKTVVPQIPVKTQQYWVRWEALLRSIKEDFEKKKINMEKMTYLFRFGRTRFDIWDIKDPRPGIKLLRSYLTRLINRFFKGGGS